MIGRKSKENPNLTAPEIREDLGLTNISARTVQRRLVEVYFFSCSLQKCLQQNLFGRRPAEKPWISAKNAKARLQWAKDHLSWTIEDWKKILWSDESSFNMVGSDGKGYVRRPKNQRYIPKYTKATVKFGGGKVMVWGCFSWSGTGPLVHVKKNERSKKGGMDSIQYRDEILGNSMLPHAQENLPEDWVCL